ncbi:MAG TPA: hypothetical protein VL328_18835 [Gemmatimonadaceae bacterium]|jgi:C4-dicarboxylate-specific signal transduction histidine kinase|nr:hypothetical protein [Gemmatimonadaceae bacterium]
MADAAPHPDDWSTISNELLHGLVHALNNRMAALGALVELARLGDEPGDTLEGLSDELTMLGQVNALFALLPERRSEPEALELSAALDDALRLHAHHPRLRHVGCEALVDDALSPVRAPRWALVRALVLLVHAAKRAGESLQDRGVATIQLRADGPEVVVRVEAPGTPAAELLALAERCGARAEREGDALTLRLPTLAELRRRERELRGESDVVPVR